MKFSHEYLLYDHDTDVNGIMSLTALMRYAQQTASLQHLRFGPQIPDLRRDGKAFILSRAAVDITGALRSCTPFTVNTWLSDARGFGFSRYTEVISGGVSVAQMSAYWGIIDLNDRRPVRVSDVPLGFGSDDDVLTLSAPTRFRPDKDAVFTEAGIHRVTYGDCDENLHVNNTNYPKIFCSCLPTMVGKRVSKFTINYLHEARLGSTFRIFVSNCNGAHIFRTVLENGDIGTEAMLLIEDIK